MAQRYPISLALGAALAVAGCDSSNGAVVAIYDPCFVVDECELAADACASMTFEFGDAAFENAICTVECFDDLDCPPSENGEQGGCYPDAIDDGFPGCVERCFDDFDCADGFICVSDQDFAFIDPGDSICVPGPS